MIQELMRDKEFRDMLTEIDKRFTKPSPKVKVSMNLKKRQKNQANGVYAKQEKNRKS
jgi:hypothetical protein